MQIKNWEYQNLQFPFHYLFFCTTKVSRSWVVSQLRTSRYSWSASSGERLIAKNWDDPSTLMNHSKLSPIKPASATSTVTNWLDAMLRRIGKIHKCCILSCCYIAMTTWVWKWQCLGRPLCWNGQDCQRWAWRWRWKELRQWLHFLLGLPRALESRSKQLLFKHA